MPTTFRPATLNDESYINELTRRTMQAYVAKTWSERELVENYFKKNAFAVNTDTWILLSGGAPAGRLTRKYVKANGTKLFLLDNLHVEAALQGKGIGSEAIEKLIFAPARAQKLPVGLVVLKTNPAKDLYERLGFKTVGESKARFSMGWNVPENFEWIGDA